LLLSASSMEAPLPFPDTIAKSSDMKGSLMD
jgi:hypothetical protein